MTKLNLKYSSLIFFFSHQISSFIFSKLLLNSHQCHIMFTALSCSDDFNGRFWALAKVVLIKINSYKKKSVYIIYTKLSQKYFIVLKTVIRYIFIKKQTHNKEKWFIQNNEKNAAMVFLLWFVFVFWVFIIFLVMVFRYLFYLRIYWLVNLGAF